MNWKAYRRVAFHTLGCKVNQQETEAMRVLFERRGYQAVAFEEQADVYVVNTCTVTQVSDKKSRQMIARAHARNPEAVIAVVGCYAQRRPEEISSIPGVKVVIGTQHRDRIVDLVEQESAQSNAVEDIRQTRTFERLPAASMERGAASPARMRAQVKIQDGCDRFCSYCIIPYARGPVRSRPVEDIREELRALEALGVQEAVLTGIHLMSYGKENRSFPSLSKLLLLLQDANIGRFRLGSLDPALVDDAFVEDMRAMRPGRLCRQFHLSLQSGSDTVLQRMNRRYTVDAYARAAQRLRDAFAGCALTTDVIAGFPGETGQEHAQSMAFVEQMGFARIHVFPYSRREGTQAYALPGQVPKSHREGRAKELIALGARLEETFLRAQIGSIQQVLPEEQKGAYLEGYTDTYARVRIKTDDFDQGAEHMLGKLLRVRIADMQAAGILDGVIECDDRNK